jgi:lysophospholipase L1-like esterase
MVATAVCLGSTSLVTGSRLARAEFALRHGDTVVFLGDSITAARTYGKIVENYTLLRFPERSVRFINAGWGADTAASGLERLERDVFRHRATVLIVAYGINDIGWGIKADAEHKRIYLDAIRGIIAQGQARRVRVYIASAAVTGEAPDAAERGFLQTMCDDGMALARSMGEHSIDVARAMRTIQRRILAANASVKPEDKVTLHVADGVHLSDLGQLAMAYAILKGLGAPAEVSAVSVDARGPQLIRSENCQIANLKGQLDAGGQLEFDRIDSGLPVNFGVFGALQFRFIPIPDELNRYMLTIANLPPGRYDLKVDGRALGIFTDRQLAASLNISSATADSWEPGGPWDAEAGILIQLTDARSQLAAGMRFLNHYLPAQSDRAAFHAQASEINDRIELLQRLLVKPRSFHYLVKRSAEK